MLGFIGDSLDQFKTMPTPAKLAVVGAVGAVAFLAYRAHKGAGTSTIPLDLAPAGGGAASPGAFSATVPTITNSPTTGGTIDTPPILPPSQVNPPGTALPIGRFLGPPIQKPPTSSTHPASFDTPAPRVDVPPIPQHTPALVAQHLNVQAARMAQLEATGRGVAPANPHPAMAQPHKLAVAVQQLRQAHLASMGRDFGV